MIKWGTLYAFLLLKTKQHEMSHVWVAVLGIKHKSLAHATKISTLILSYIPSPLNFLF